MRSLRVALMAASVLSVVSLQAQTADEIISKHIGALGGKDVLGGIKTMYIEYDMEIMGQSAPGASWLVNGKGFKNEVDFGGQKIVQCITDKGGWAQNPLMGQPTPEALPEAAVKMSQDKLDPAGPLFNYAAKGYTVELMGKDTIKGKTTYKLKLKSKAGTESFYWLDATSYYPLKTTIKANVNGADVETSVGFDNYKKSDFGFMYPVNTEITLPEGFALQLTNKKVAINQDIDVKIFDMPK